MRFAEEKQREPLSHTVTRNMISDRFESPATLHTKRHTVAFRALGLGVEGQVSFFVLNTRYCLEDKNRHSIP